MGKSAATALVHALASTTNQRRISDREVRAQIYGVLVAKLRMACLVDGDEIDIERYHSMQLKIAKKLEQQFIASVVDRS